MINPSESLSTDYLAFECDCGARAEVVKASHDGPGEIYDIREIDIMRIDLKCEKCGDEDSYKVAIRWHLGKQEEE